MWAWKEKRGTIRHYDLQAAIYDVQYKEEQNTKIEDILTVIEFGSNELVLDLGCGTGFLFQYIPERVGFLVGVDSSRKVLEQAKKYTKNMPNISLVCADADNTPFPDHIFDKIFSITVLQNMPEPTRTINEMKRIGKPAAIFAITGLKKKFTQDRFVALLKKAQLKNVKLITNQYLKGHIAVCSNNK